jgi:ABC-type glycerol-3-phosphate transport system substrate-binding protein
MKRRAFLKGAALAGTATAIGACAAPPAQTVKEVVTQIVEVPVETVKEVEKVVTPTPVPGTLVALHRREYFEEMEKLYEQAAYDFIATQPGWELDISTIAAEATEDFVPKMAEAVRAGDPPTSATTSAWSAALALRSWNRSTMP